MPPLRNIRIGESDTESCQKENRSFGPLYRISVRTLAKIIVNVLHSIFTCLHHAALVIPVSA
jgi:hypothetical protein